MSRSPDPMLNFSRGKNRQKLKQGPCSEVSEIIDLEIFCIIQVTQKAVHRLISATWTMVDGNKAQRMQGSVGQVWPPKERASTFQEHVFHELQSQCVQKGLVCLLVSPMSSVSTVPLTNAFTCLSSFPYSANYYTVPQSCWPLGYALRLTHSSYLATGLCS